VLRAKYPTAPCCIAGRYPDGGSNGKKFSSSRLGAGAIPCAAVPDCVFCAIVAGERAAEIVHRDDVAVAFLDRTPLFPGHLLVVPTTHVVTLPDLEDVGPFFERVQRMAAAVPLALGAQGTFVANNNVVSQSVPHLHVHVVPRTKGDGLRGFFWPRSRYAAGEAEAVADRLRTTLASMS
jgi:histidine triad (HIT) family protein